MNAIRNIIKSIRPDLNLDEECQLLTQGIIDSLDVVLIVSEISAYYQVVIPAELITPKNFDSVNSIQNLIAELQSQ